MGKRTVNWRGTKVKDMTPEQKVAYEAHLERSKNRRAEQKKAVLEEGVVASTAFAKDAIKATRRFPMPFEQYYNEDVGNKILMHIACGGDLIEVCKEVGVPPYPIVMQWVRPYLPVDEKAVSDSTLSQLHTFRMNYVEARKNKLEKELDDIIRISDTATDKDSSAAAKVRVQARVTMLERINVQLFAPASKTIKEEEDRAKDADLFIRSLEEAAERRKQRLAVEAASTKVVKPLKIKDNLLLVESERVPENG